MPPALNTPGRSETKLYEFTPIGYIKEKENIKPAAQNTEDDSISRNKRPSIDAQFEEEPHAKRSHNSDDTLNSTRIFNDTSFEDTLPEASRNPTTHVKKNLISELINTETGKRDIASNPLKEQQDALYKLNMENYNLRVKCNSLLKFLNNVTDEGELKKNLEILDELQDWKTKYQMLNKTFRELQSKFDELESRESEKMQDIEADNGKSDSERQLLEEELFQTKEKLSKLKDVVKALENKVMEIRQESKEREQQSFLKNELLQTKIRELEGSISDKESELVESKKKVQRLVNELQEFDHQSGSLLELEKQIDMKNEGIRNLETKLTQLAHSKQSLERELSAKTQQINDLREEHDQYRSNNNKKLEELVQTNSTGDTVLKAKLEALRQEKAQLENANEELLKKNGTLNTKIRDGEREIEMLKRKVQELSDEYEKEKHARKGLLHKASTSNKEALGSLQDELEKLNDSKRSLERENERLKQQIVNQASRSPLLKENANKKLLEKEKEIRLLQSTIHDIEEEVSHYKRQIHEAKREHSREVAEFEIKLQSLETEPLIERRKLEKEISMLQLELQSAQETKNRELALWENKCEALKRENQQLSKQEEGYSDNLNRIIAERQKDLNDLVQRCSDLSMEKLQLNRELNELKSSNDDYKQELKKVTSRLDFITKEFVKLKESIKDRATETSNRELSEKWLEKYHNMKQRLLAELKSLQTENLSLEKKLLDRNVSSSRPTTTSSNGENRTQDLLDYYRLKYHNEIKQNNDLKVVNGYLNRVLKASSQHLRLDILKLENEVPPSEMYQSFGRRLRFKTAALAVLACIRMKNTATRYKWDAQRIGYLQRKIALDDDRITW